MYLIRGTAKALLIDLGNNYIDGYAGDEIPPRKNAAEAVHDTPQRSQTARIRGMVFLCLSR